MDTFQHPQSHTLQPVGTMSPVFSQRSVNPRPKVAILTNYPYDGASFTGGVETATAGLLEGLQSHVKEFDLHVIALSKTIAQSTIETRNGMTFHFIAIPGAWYSRPHVLSNILNARAKLKNLQPDIVHCQDNMALAIGAILAHPERKVFTIHGIKSVESQVWEGPEYWSHQMDALLERWVRQRFEEVITISPYVDRFLSIHVRKHHITNPVRKLFFQMPQAGVNAERFLVVGSLTRLKRPLDVIKAFSILNRAHPHASLSIIGQAEDRGYETEMKHYVTDAKLDGVEFLGARTQEEVAELMRRSTALVLASVQENTPMVIAESMASGLPVVASNVGGVPVMVRDGIDGLLFSSGNVEQLAGLMITLLQDSGLRRRLSQNGRDKAIAAYTSDAVAAATISMYHTLMST